MPQVRRSRGRNLTVVNPTREFEDIYDRMGQIDLQLQLQDRELVITGEIPESEQKGRRHPRQIEIKG